MATPQLQELAALYDSEIDAHIVEICRLRKKRNADCSATRKLPAEILAQIFDIVVYSARGVSGYPLQWVAITYVCGRWRNVALNEPTLWTDLTDVHPKWVREAFARSKAAPLRVRGGYGADSTRRHRCVLVAALKSPERLKALEIHSNDSFIAHLIKPTPLLESLHIFTSLKFPPNFLGGDAPRLRSVKYHGSLPADASWLANLTSLQCFGKLRLEATWFSHLTFLRLGMGWNGMDVVNGTAQPVNMDILLSVLESMPLLERLSLSLPVGFDLAPCTRSTPVYLRYLRDITADFGGVMAMAKIFNHLRVDDIHRICTYLPHNTRKAEFIEPVCHFFESCYHGINPSLLRRTDAGLEIHKTSHYTGASTPVLLFKAFDPTDLSSLMNLLPRCVLRTYDIRTSYHIYGSAQALGLINCDTIEELRLTSGNLLLSFLALPADDANTIPYPSLRLLCIKDTNFTHTYPLIPQLKRWLEQRATVSKIDNLVFEDCHLSEMDVESLREVLPVRSC